jgi:hypothetical protein
MTTPTAYAKGDIVVLTQQVRAEPLNFYTSMLFPSGAEGEVTRESATKVLVRLVSTAGFNLGHPCSVWIEKTVVQPKVIDPNAPKPRKLGEAPAGMIEADDPRIMWLWEDAGTFAEQKGYCSQYDALADALNVPGREREFTITQKIGSFEAKIKVKARSRKLAEAKVAAELKATASE